MATSKRDNESKKLLDELAELDRELRTNWSKFQSTINEMGDSVSRATEDALRNYTKISNTVKDAMLESAKMTNTLEETIKLRNRINQLQAEEKTIQAQLNTLLKGGAEEERQRYEEAKKIFDERKKYAEEAYKNYDVEEEHYNNLLEQLKNVGDRRTKVVKEKVKELEALREESAMRLSNLDIERELAEVEFSSSKAQLDSLDNAKMIEADILKSQLKSIKATLAVVQNLKKTNIQLLTSKGFWKEMGSRLFPNASDKISSMKDDITKFGKGAGGALIVAGGLASLAKMILDSMFRSDQEATDLAKNMTISKKEARQLLLNMEYVSSTMEGVMFSSRDILKSQLQLNEALGTAMLIRGEDLVTVTKIRDLLGITEEAVANLAKLSSINGKNFETIKNEILGSSKAVQLQNGIFLNDQKILESTLKITGGIRANFKGNVKEMAAAVAKAKLLGVELSQIDKISQSLLNFESSISAELEAELLTGKALNLERARSAALMNDMSTVMEEMSKQAGTFENFMGMNRIAQEKLAQAFGFTRDEFSDMMVEQTALNRLRSAGLMDEQKNLIENFNRLKREGGDVSKILGETVSQRIELQSAQEKFNKTIEKLQTVFDRLLQGGFIEKVVNLLANFVQDLANGRGILRMLVGGLESNTNFFEGTSLSDEAKSSKKEDNKNEEQLKLQREQNELLKKLPSMMNKDKQPQIVVKMNSMNVGTAQGMDKSTFA